MDGGPDWDTLTLMSRISYAVQWDAGQRSDDVWRWRAVEFHDCPQCGAKAQRSCTLMFVRLKQWGAARQPHRARVMLARMIDG